MTKKLKEKKLTRPMHRKFKFEPTKKWWGEVHVFPTSRGMLMAIRREGPDPGNCAAMCRVYQKVISYPGKGKRGKDTGKVCDIYLSQEDLCVEYIVHEVTHACMAWAKRVGFNWKTSHSVDERKIPYFERPSERWAYAVGRVAEQIVLAYQIKTGILKKP